MTPAMTPTEIARTVGVTRQAVEYALARPHTPAGQRYRAIAGGKPDPGRAEPTTPASIAARAAGTTVTELAKAMNCSRKQIHRAFGGQAPDLLPHIEAHLSALARARNAALARGAA